MPAWAWILIAVAAAGLLWLVVGALRKPGLGRDASSGAGTRLIEPGGDDVPARAEGLVRPEDDPGPHR